MIVRAKLLGKVNERRVVGWDSVALRRIREGDEFEIPDVYVEVDEVINGEKTGKKIKKNRYFSEKIMEAVETPNVSKPTRQKSVSASNDLI